MGVFLLYIFSYLFEYFEHCKCMVCEQVRSVTYDSITSHEASKSMLENRTLFVVQSQSLVLVFERVDCY